MYNFYRLVVDLESCGADLTVKLTNRNGNNIYLKGKITDAGKVEYEYSHADGRDDDVQISLDVLKDQTNYNGSVDCYKSM